ncbi:PPE family protein [Mycobacterium lepromatosis]|uniref:PPE family protein n=1 Tax=Mycobacterium lepromatosis TaxID=480418 RepID=UPI000679A4E2|nr:PPE family protein [Mycobacterium lepromatosis]
MSATVWMASLPKVHSLSLSSGAGPGLLLATAAAWSMLSAEYSAVAAEPGALLASSVPGRSACVAVGLATRYEAAAKEYTSAVAMMRMLVESVANRIIHGVSVATKFFGVNAIPIALNVADYLRMWAQTVATIGLRLGGQ